VYKASSELFALSLSIRRTDYFIVIEPHLGRKGVNAQIRERSFLSDRFLNLNQFRCFMHFFMNSQEWTQTLVKFYQY
jgi:hypothetical protein